jgi:4-amino-4-deoxy-L-arabinose transferase-like glycosyltransferase
MATEGGWLTPRRLGRYALYKPSVLYWLSGISVKILGRRALPLRLPSILAGAATLTLVFAWAGMEAALLLLSSHLFFTLSRLALTDALLTSEIRLAMFALSRDPTLRSRRALWMFGIASGAAIMTKSVAGTLPLLILPFFSWKRLPHAVGIAALVAAPWHVYQLAAHPHWFWAEYFRSEIFSLGLTPPAQTTTEGHVAFYFKRLTLPDPVLFLATVLALIPWQPRLVVVWLVVTVGAALAFRYQNAAFILPAYPAMAILADGAIPDKARKWALRAIFLLLVVKLAAPNQPWGLPFGPEFVNPTYEALNRYAALHRGNDPILIEPEDQFYSASLPLARVRYLFLDPRPRHRILPLDFQYLGILMMAEDFNRLPELLPQFERRLREFDLNSTEPIATTILARNQDEIAEVVRDHSDADFFVHRQFRLSSKVIQRPGSMA